MTPATQSPQAQERESEMTDLSWSQQSECVKDVRGGARDRSSVTSSPSHSEPETTKIYFSIGNGQTDGARNMTENVLQTLNCMHETQAVMCANGTSWGGARNE